VLELQGNNLPRDFCGSNDLKDKFDAAVRKKTGSRRQ
jgi:hypothetical protein